MNNLQIKFVNSYKKLDGPNRLREAENEFLKTCPRFILEAICFSII